MPVIRERLGSTSVGPVGVRAVNTGGVEKYSGIGRAANQIVQASIKEMGAQATKEGTELAFQADSKSIVNINPLTGKPEALNELNGEGFLGRTAGQAYQRVILDRYQNEVSIDIQRKTNELVLKYQDDPDNVGKVTGALNEYLKNMAFSTEQNGKPTIYTNYIEQQGALELAKTELSLGKLNASRQRTKLGEHILLSNKDDKETAYEFGKTNQDSKKLKAFIEARVAKNEDGEAAYLLKEGTGKRHGVELQVAYVFGKIEGLYPKFMMNDYQRSQFELAIRTGGEVTTNLNDEYLDDLEDLLQFTKDLPSEDLDNVMAYAERLSSDYRSAENAELVERQRVLDDEKDDIQDLKDKANIAYDQFELKVETNIGGFSAGRYNKLDLIYNQYNDSENPNANPLGDLNALIKHSEKKMKSLTDDFFNFASKEVNVNESLLSDIKAEELRNYLAIAARDRNIDSLRLAIISPDGDGFENLTSFQKEIVRKIKSSSLYDSKQTNTVTNFLSEVKNTAQENINNYAAKKVLQDQGNTIAQGGRSNTLTQDDLTSFVRTVVSTPSKILSDSEKDNIINGIKLAGAEGLINRTQNASSQDLNAISLFIQSDGKNDDPAIANLSKNNKEIAEELTNLIRNFPEGKKEIIRTLEKRETDIRTAEQERKNEKKKRDAEIKLRNEVLKAGNTKKEKKHREDMDKVMSERLNISSAADPRSLTPAFYPLARITLPESLISGLNNFLSGTAPEVDHDTLLKHAFQLFNDESPVGPINRFGDIFGEDEAILREVVVRKNFFGDSKTANEILAEIKQQEDSPAAAENFKRVFADSKPDEFVRSKITSDITVVSELTPIAEMYARMGKKSEEIITELKGYIDRNYKESEHVIDPNAPFERGKSLSKMALDIVFPDPEEKAEFIKLINEQLPREFKLGEPQDISYIQETEFATRSGQKRITESTVVTGQTKEVFLVPFNGGDVPQFYAYFKDENNEIRPLIYDRPLDEFGSSELTWPLFDTSMTETFAKNKYNQLLRSIEAEAREEERKARENGGKPVISEDSILRRLPIVKFYGWDLF
jgi:hypothetical protein